MKNTRKLIALGCTAALVTVLSACEREADGPMEKLGESIDDTTEALADGGGDLGNALEDACEELKEGVGAKDEDC